MNHRIWMGLLAALLAATVGTVRPAAASTAFPHFPCIEANVAFWKDVFSRYTSRQGILHDDTELGVVYGTVDLLPRDLPGSVEENRSRIRKAKAQWHRRLLRLSVNPAPQDDRDRRILALFGPGASPRELRAAARRIRCQTGQSDRFRSGLVRSGRHMESFRRIFREEGLPEELTYLPHVESSFDVHAFSKAGAAGIWQFTRSTGRRFLRIDEVVDERRDPLRSARAAAMLLKENYEKLGSWPLAVTAYNHGAEGMVRAKRRHGDFPTILRRYRSRSFGFASRNFYAEFLAALSVARDAATHFPGIWPTSPRPSRICVIEGFADLRDLADHFGFGTDHLLALNPSLQPAVAAGEKRVPRHFSLRVPETQGAMWAGRPPASLMRPEQLPSRRHRIRKGETLSGIARRYRVDLQALLVANGLHMRSTIFPGQVLRLPGGPKARTARVETPEPSGGTDSGVVTPLRRIPVADG